MKNEYIKVFKKKSTIIWIALVLLFTIGFQVIMKISVDNSQNYYYYGNYAYMSEEYVDSMINDNKNFSSSNDSYNSDIPYYEKIKEYKLYDLTNDLYNELWQTYYTYYDAANNPSTKEEYTEEERAKMTAKYDSLLSKIATGDYKSFYTELAANETKKTYTFEGSEKAITAPYQYKVEHSCTPDLSQSKSDLVDRIVSYQDTLESYASATEPAASSKQEAAMESYLIAMYQLENDLPYVVSDSSNSNDFGYDSANSKYWYSLENSTSLILVLCILIIVIAGGCIASEFSTGTIKFLLINPVKRSKLIISKYLMVLSLTGLLVAGFYVVNVILGMILYGTGDLGAPFLSVVDQTVVSSSAFLYIAKQYLYSAVEVICYGTMAFAISSLFRNSSVAIGASVACLVGGSMVTLLLQQLRQDWGRYLLFANTDLLSIKEGASIYPHHTMGFAITMIVIYMVVMLLMAYDGFCRKEV